MLLPALLAAAALAQAPQVPDSAFPPRGDVMRLFTDCTESRWPYGTEERFVPKTREEIEAGVVRLRTLEEGWRAWFAVRAGDSIRTTLPTAWRYPLAERGRLLNNFRSPRPGGLHGALDIFVPREGGDVLTPASGVVVAAGDGWKGGYERRGRGFYYDGDGLSRRAGNGVILFDPGSGGYFLFSHLQEGVRVRPGDVIAAGAPIGRVGHTGNAVRPGGGRHLHLAYKEHGTACSTSGVLVARNPFARLVAARQRDLPIRRPAAPSVRRP